MNPGEEKKSEWKEIKKVSTVSDLIKRFEVPPPVYKKEGKKVITIKEIPKKKQEDSKVEISKVEKTELQSCDPQGNSILHLMINKIITDIIRGGEISAISSMIKEEDAKSFIRIYNKQMMTPLAVLFYYLEHGDRNGDKKPIYKQIDAIRDLVDQLIAWGANSDILVDERSLLDIALKNQYTAISQALIAKGKTPSSISMIQRFVKDSVQSSDEQSKKNCINLLKNMYPRCKDLVEGALFNTISDLREASEQERTVIEQSVVLYVKSGVNCNIYNKEGNAALHVLAFNYNDAVVTRILTFKGINPNIFMNNLDKKTPLHVAAAFGAFEMVKKLVDRPDIDLGVVDGGGKTALHWAVISNQSEIAMYLIAKMKKKGISLEKKDGEGRTAFFYASLTANGAVVNELIKEKSASFKDLDQFNEDCFKAFVNSGVDINASDASGLSLINYFKNLQKTRFDVVSIVELLKHKGADFGVEPEVKPVEKPEVKPVEKPEVKPVEKDYLYESLNLLKMKLLILAYNLSTVKAIEPEEQQQNVTEENVPPPPDISEFNVGKIEKKEIGEQQPIKSSGEQKKSHDVKVFIGDKELQMQRGKLKSFSIKKIKESPSSLFQKTLKKSEDEDKDEDEQVEKWWNDLPEERKLLIKRESGNCDDCNGEFSEHKIHAWKKEHPKKPKTEIVEEKGKETVEERLKKQQEREMQKEGPILEELININKEEAPFFVDKESINRFLYRIKELVEKAQSLKFVKKDLSEDATYKDLKTRNDKNVFFANLKFDPKTNIDDLLLIWNTITDQYIKTIFGIKILPRFGHDERTNEILKYILTQNDVHLLIFSEKDIFTSLLDSAFYSIKKNERSDIAKAYGNKFGIFKSASKANFNVIFDIKKFSFDIKSNPVSSGFFNGVFYVNQITMAVEIENDFKTYIKTFNDCEKKQTPFNEHKIFSQLFLRKLRFTYAKSLADTELKEERCQDYINANLAFSKFITATKTVMEKEIKKVEYTGPTLLEQIRGGIKLKKGVPKREATLEDILKKDSEEKPKYFTFKAIK